MSEADRVSFLTVFQTLKTKTTRLLDPVVQAEGLTPLQASVLLHLSCRSAAVGDISEVTCMGQANASSLCKKLEQGGFLTRSRGEADGRVVTLSLTPKGRETAGRIQRRLDRYLELPSTPARALTTMTGTPAMRSSTSSPDWQFLICSCS